MPTLLVTGANRGLGLELVKQYSEENWKIHACCRAPSEAKELNEIKKQKPLVSLHALDVTNYDSIDSLAETLSNEPIDLLINSAGSFGDGAANLESSDFSAWTETFIVNTFSPIKMTKAFLKNTSKGERKTIVTFSSKMGSIALTQEIGRYDYQGSKAALNKMMKVLSLELRDFGITVVLIHPGWVRTKMGGSKAPLEPSESILSVRKLIDSLTIKDSGKFLNYDGQEIPW